MPVSEVFQTDSFSVNKTRFPRNPSGAVLSIFGCFFLTLCVQNLADGGLSVNRDASTSVMISEEMLERVTFVLFGQEREEIAEVSLEDAGYRITLFNEKLASHYSVVIALSDLISSQPLGMKISAEIQSQRSLKMEQREQVRRERRAAKKAERSSNSRDQSASSGSDRRKSGNKKSEVSFKPLSETIEKGMSREECMDWLDEYGSLLSEMSSRNGTVLSEGTSALAGLAEWSEESESKPRVFHALKSESLTIVESAEDIKRSLSSRIREIQRTREQLQQGFFQVRDMPEVLDRIRLRVLKIDQKLGALESLQWACADGILALGSPVILAKQDSEISSQKPRQRTVNKTTRAKGSKPAVDVVPVRALEDEVGVTRSVNADPESSRFDRKPTRKSERSGSSSKKKTKEPVLSAPAKDESLNESLNESPVGSGNSYREIILGALLGALGVLLISQLLKKLP